MPSYNQGRFLTNALESLASQSYPHLEVIVVDGGSSDGTVQLLEQSPVVSHWLSEPDEGQTQALNKGFRLATGEVFGWLNCDERYRPGALWKVGEAFAQDRDLDLVFGHRIVVDQEGRELKRLRQPALHPKYYALYASGLLFSDATFWKADLHRRTGELDEVVCRRFSMDFDWFARLSLNLRRWRRLDAYLSEFIEHEGRVTLHVPELPEIHQLIKARLFKMARIKSWQALLLCPLFLFLTRFHRLGWQGFWRPPGVATIFRITGWIK